MTTVMGYRDIAVKLEKPQLKTPPPVDEKKVTPPFVRKGI